LYANNSGDIILKSLRASNLLTITYTGGQAELDDGRFHRILVLWYGGIGGAVALYVDDYLVGADVLSGSATGVYTLYVGNPGSSFLGYYEDLSLGITNPFALFPRYSLWSKGARAHSLSGRDYTQIGQHWRDTLKNEMGEYVLRNDTGLMVLPSGDVSEGGDVLFRQTNSELTLGEFARLSRMFGLLLDRITDFRRFFMNHLTSRSAEYEYLELLGETVGATDVDPKWNVEVRRRFLEVMFFCNNRSGTLDAFTRLVRFLGFRLLQPDAVVGPLVQVYRRFLDSVVDPDRADVPFDSITFDSGAEDTQFVDIMMKLFIQNFSSSAAATSIPATRRLTDITATFLTTAVVGSLIILHDRNTPADNGQYIITNVVGNTIVEIDRDWPVGSLSGLSYRLHWRVPRPDPYNDQVLTRLDSIRARWQNLEVSL
jgi:hypothetical protein